MMKISSRKRILITGAPGVGKTTVIREVARALANSNPAGFYTAEIRDKSARKGFELISLDDHRGVLSHVDIKSPYRIGKYGVDVDAFEAFLETIDLLDPAHIVVIIDEIGKMECLSAKFRSMIDKLLESDKTVIATIALKGGGLIDSIKHRPDVTLYEVTPRNRNSIMNEVVAALKM